MRLRALAHIPLGDRVKIHEASDVSLKTIRDAYLQRPIRGASWRRIVAAACALGIAPPPPRPAALAVQQ